MIADGATTETATPTPAIEPLAVDSKAAAELVGISDRHWRRLDDAERVPCSIRFGQCKRWGVAELRAWVAAGCPARSRWSRQFKAAAMK